MKPHSSLVCILGFWSANLLGQNPGYLLWQQIETTSSNRSAVVEIGDINGDGFNDVLSGGDQVQVRSGVDGSTLSVVPVPSLSPFIAILAGLGDINNDNIPDFAVGNPNFTGGPFLNGGVAYIFSGRNNSIIYTFHGTAANQYFGRSIANAGDTDGDGVNDFIIGGPTTTATTIGMALIISGRTGQVLHTLAGLNMDDHFGNGVAGIGDADLDGYSDVAVAAPHDGSGRVYAFSGRTGVQLWNVFGPANPSSYMGWSLARAGDVNNDGRADVITGIAENLGFGANRGAVRVLSGLNGSVIYHIPGTGNGDNFGWSTAGGADFNGDNIPDIVGGPRTASYVKVYSGSNGSLIAHIVGQTGMAFGQTVSIGKIDADPYPDIISTNAYYGAGNFLAYSLVAPATAVLVGTPTIGNTVTLQLSSPGDAGLMYAAGFALGSTPGITLLDTRNIPLNPDPLLSASLSPNPVFVNNVANLNTSGAATVRILIPSLPGLIGLNLFGAFVVMDPASPSSVRRVSNVVPITIH